MELENSDIVSERAVLAGIAQHGSNAFIDISDIISQDSFTEDIHAIIYQCFAHILKDDVDAKIDIASIFAAANDLNLNSIIEKPEERKLLRGIMNFNIELSNVRRMAARIRKLEIARLLRKQLGKANKSLKEITGDEPINHILGLAENIIFDFSSLLTDSSSTGPQAIGEGLEEYIQYLIDHPVDNVGIASGMPWYDKCIGGGFRPKTISIIGARPKSGKTMLADNIALYIAHKLNIPVLNLDTEMSKDDHWHRMLANISGVTINDIENGQFASCVEDLDSVKRAKDILKSIPYYYESIAGQPFEDTLSLIRRWLKRYVGFQSNGLCNRCLIIYDYLKLMSTEGMTRDLKEYQLLGFQMTAMHNFMVKYGPAALAFIQLNRDGIEKEDTSVASGSDRIIWLCSNFTVYKKKNVTEKAEEIAQGIHKAGNRKLVPIVARHGSGLEDDDYICVQSQYHIGKITELGTRKSLENKDSGIDYDDESDKPEF